MDGWMSYMDRWQEYQINGWKGKGKRREKERLEGTERERRGERESKAKAVGGGERKAAQCCWELGSPYPLALLPPSAGHCPGWHGSSG